MVYLLTTAMKVFLLLGKLQRQSFAKWGLLPDVAFA